MARAALLALFLLLTAAGGLAEAQTQPRAWLDRERIALGETVTLNIESAGTDAPDYTPLEADFVIAGRTSRRELTLVDGERGSRTLFGVALRPLRAGTLQVPALQVGGQRTQPLQLDVASAPIAPVDTAADVFLESVPDDGEPYVQQAVGWVVRLHSAVPLVSGQLDQPAPPGVTLRQVGEDAQYSRTVSGRRYNVIERRYLLIPERSGPLEIPGARFEGRGARGFFDDVLGRGGHLQARARPQWLHVQPVPDAAPQPWLPLHALQLRYRTYPGELQAGAAGTLEVELVADGAGVGQLPDLELPAVPGLRVFPEPPQIDQQFVDGRPRVTVRRQFSLVPAGEGPLELPGMELQWWDVGGDRARTARLEPLTLEVRAGAAPTGAPAPVSAASAPGAMLPPPSGMADAADADAGAHAGPSNRGWIAAAAGFALLWLLTLGWALRRRADTPRPPEPASTAAAGRKVDPAQLRRALAVGDFGEVADALCAAADPPARHLDEVRARLADPEQVAAVDALQQARWAGGDGPAAREQLRAAFGRGPRWREGATAEAPLLPPLYPDRNATSGTR